MKKRKATTKVVVKKERTAASQDKTGAPPAYFLQALQALQVENSVVYLVERMRTERESLAQESTDDITKRIYRDLLELAHRVRYPRTTRKGLENAAEHLSAMATTAASFLEQLADTDASEIILAAMRKHFWPVNLQLGVKRKKGSSEYVKTLKGADKVKDYLVSIRLGQSPPSPLKSLNDPNATPFTKAAELLLRELLNWRDRGVWRNFTSLSKLTSWSNDLLLLDYPMTADNVDKWWAVAKHWMDEQWATNPQLFKPLIESCKSKGWSLASGRHDNYPSEVRRTVIDVRLKEAFCALVAPDL